MKGVVIFAVIFCVALIGLGVFISAQSSGNSRIVAMNQQYSNRQQAGGWVRGSLHPKVVITEYADYQSPQSATMSAILTDALSQAGDYTQLIYRVHTSTKNSNSRLAAEAAEASGRQGKYWEMHDYLYATQATWSNDSASAFLDFVTTEAQAFAINVNQFRSDMNDQSEDTEINKDVDAANRLGVTSTPALVVNGQIVPNTPNTVVDMLKLIKNAENTPVATTSVSTGL